MTPTDVHVLLVDHAPVFGGAERSLLDLAARLPGHGVGADIVTAAPALAERARAAGVRFHRLDLPRLRSVRAPLRAVPAVRQLRHLLRDTGATVIVANTARAAPYAAAATAGSPIAFVWYVRDFSLAEGAPRRRRLDAAIRRVLQGRAAATIAVSVAVAAGLPSSRRVVVVPNGVAVPHGRVDGLAFRQRWEVPPGVPVVGVVGRLRPWKGQDRFLQAMASIVPSHPSARFVLVGSGGEEPDAAYEGRLQRLAGTGPLRGRVTCCGWVDDPGPAYAALDVLVHPGDPEPFGRVVAEAMSHGVPVVGFAQGALPELIEPDVTGLLVAPDDPNGLAGAVSALLRDPARRHRMSVAARRLATRRFDVEVTAQRVAELLRRVGGR